MQDFDGFYKMLIITEISKEKTKELTIYGILCRNVTIFYRQELVFFISSAGEIGSVQEFKTKLLE